MEDRQRPNIHEEFRELDISIEETEPNKHRKRMDSLELVETIRSLKIEVQSCRDDNDSVESSRGAKSTKHLATIELKSLAKANEEWIGFKV